MMSFCSPDRVPCDAKRTRKKNQKITKNPHKTQKSNNNKKQHHVQQQQQIVIINRSLPVGTREQHYGE